MSALTTIALLERKPDIPRDLFSRYWRDVHGVMAARIPGFASYTQHHVEPIADLGSSIIDPFEGIAVVTFAASGDRDGLIESDITKHIHRDEQNVFRRALLYNLEAGASTDTGSTDIETVQSYFIVIPQQLDGHVITRELADASAEKLSFFDLSGADPAGWNETDVEERGTSRLFGSVIQCWWSDAEVARSALSQAVSVSNGLVSCYRTMERYVMVEDGLPTLLGLRGLDAVRTINEANASNQRERQVLCAIYGNIAG
jgi:hypothetical protein